MERERETEREREKRPFGTAVYKHTSAKYQKNFLSNTHTLTHLDILPHTPIHTHSDSLRHPPTHMLFDSLYLLKVLVLRSTFPPI